MQPLRSKEWPEGTGMIYLGMSRWEGMWKSRHQLMSRFSRQFPVLYVEPWVTLQAIRTGRTKLSRIVNDCLRPPVAHFEPNVYVLGGSALRPISGSEKLRDLTRRRWIQAIRRASNAAGIARPILWICRPEMGFAVGQLGEQMSIYHVVDEYGGYTGLDEDAQRQLGALEATVLDKVDLSIVASPELAQAKAGRGRDIVVLENGVSPRQYREARQSAVTPTDIGALPRPRIGYSGLIGKRLDLDLLGQVADRQDTGSIVLIGKVDDRECEDEIKRLADRPNVHFLGEKHPREVAAYIHALDIGLLPYTINLETRHISPIKMYEYWAAGIPVVSTAIPAARRHGHAVSVAGDSSEFVKLIERSLREFDADMQAKLLELAAANSWQARVDQASCELLNRIVA